MKIFGLVALATVLLGTSVHGQVAPSPADSTAVESSSGVGDFEGLEDELSVALGELAETLGVLANRLANDPELRVTAARAATSLVTIAAAVVEEQSVVVEEALRRAADMVAEISDEATADPVE